MSDHILHDYIAGSIGGAAGVFVGHPFDTVKVQLQTQEFGGKYFNLLDVYRTVKGQSLSNGFFRGLSWPLASYGVINAIFFGTYGLILKKLNYEEDPEKPPKYFTLAVASAVATVPTMAVFCPVEVIKTTLQSQIPHSAGASSQRLPFYQGPVEASRNVLKTSGVRGMYRAFGIHAMRDTPGNVMYMVSYSMFQYEGKRLLPSVPSQVINFVGGGFAGVLSWVIIMPIDVVKSKLQADPFRRMYKGSWDCVKRVYHSGGIQAFFTGCIPMALRAFPVNAITLMVYSECLTHMKED